MLGPILAAGASIAGGLLSAKSQDKANKQAEANALRQEALQKEFAQSGIQWKVKDAEAAGVHPLFALGANTTSYQPTNVGGGATDFGFLGEAGQNIGRAIDATRSTPASAMALQLGKIQLEGAQLDNDLKRTQLASAIRTNAIGAHPGLPGPFTRSAIEGQSSSGQYDDTLLPLMHSANAPQYTTNMRAFGKDISPSPSFSDAQSYEDRYGEMSDFIAGPAIALADYFRNIYPYTKREVYDKLRR